MAVQGAAPCVQCCEQRLYRASAPFRRPTRWLARRYFVAMVVGTKQISVVSIVVIVVTVIVMVIITIGMVIAIVIIVSVVGRPRCCTPRLLMSA